MDDLNTIRKMVNTYGALVFRVGITLLVVSTLFLFTNLLSEIYGTPKFLALLIFTALVLILLMLKFTIDGKVVLIRTPLDIPLLILLAVGIVSTFLSSAPYVSALGNGLNINGSLISIIALVLFYFVLVNSLKGVQEVNWIFAVITALGQVLAVMTLLSYAGIKLLPSPWVTGANFTTTGSSFSTTAILALLVPLIVVQILNSSNMAIKALNALFLILTGITIALTGTWATWIAALFGLVLTCLVSSRNLSDLSNLRNLSQTKLAGFIGLIITLVIIALVAILSFIPPIGNAKNPIYTLAKNFPREIQLDLIPAWKISVSTFRDAPFWGSGPATYLFDFTNYKPVEFNSTKVWNLRFDSSFNEYLQTLATLGSVGLIALLSLTALYISNAYKVVSTATSSLPSASEANLKLALAISGLAFFVILALHSSTLVVWIIGLLILAAFMVVNLSEVQRSWNNRAGDLKSMFLRIAGNITNNSSEETIRIDALPGVLLTIALALVLFASYFGGKFVLADYHHRLALNAVAKNDGITAYNELVTAEKFNAVSDLYRTDLAQINFALANAIAAAKGPTEASPAGTFTDQDKQNIQILLQQSINEARSATTLSPRSAVNWEILGLLYRQIAGVAQNALVFSLDSYGRAIYQDPLNPALRTNVGGVYYAVKNYDMAIRFFTDAVNLKPDFANGYYNLSVALRDKGDLTSAQALAEKVLTLLETSSPDYKTASDYLADLKAKNTSAAEPPAAQTQGALQQNQLPKVINLPKPEKIATPEAIKKPVATPTPIAAPTKNPTSIPSEHPTATP